MKKESDNPNFSMVIQMSLNDSLIFWEQRKLNNQIHENNQWYSILEEIKFPGNFSTNNSIVKMYFMNNDSVNTYIDDLSIQLSSFDIPTFIPKLAEDMGFCSHEVQKTIKNNNYSINICENGEIQILDCNGAFIFEGLTHITEILHHHPDSGIVTNLTSSFAIRNIETESITLSASNSVCEIRIKINTTDTEDKMQFSTETVFFDSTRLYREALVFNYVGELKEVYKKNRKVDVGNFEDEYWLEKQGCKIGSNENTFYMYNQQNISSLQLDTKQKYLIVNLDYSKDHPLLHFPLMDKANNIYEDISFRDYYKNEIRENEFTFSIGLDNDFFARILRNPHGFIATYVFTEHADYTDIKTHRATYFGDSEITNPEDATGGFIKYKVPVTKSVFYSNYDKEMNDDERNGTSFNTPITSIRHTPEFFDFLSGIQKYNIDICLHTPEQHTTTRKNLIAAAQFAKENFNSPCWIDHGYDNGNSNNREDIVCDGLIKDSEFYSLDILKQNNIKYLWNCYYEDARPFSKFNFYSFIGSPYIGFGNAFPTPYYWQHQSEAPGVYFWPTHSVLEPGNNWDYYFNAQRINDFIQNYTVEFNHCYPAWINPSKGFWDYSGEDKLVINPSFDKMLKTISDYRDKGLVNLSTIKDVLNYWTQLEGVMIENVGKNKFIITNNNDKSVDGFSIAVQANMVYVNNEIPNHKFYLNDLICWFDLQPYERKVLTLIPQKE
ncbi:MAG: hypothetical protein P8I82_06575 [Flavobacteriales bacterium]|nr:hypothetical protein [Flavobacteriales bacterium]